MPLKFFVPGEDYKLFGLIPGKFAFIWCRSTRLEYFCLDRILMAVIIFHVCFLAPKKFDYWISWIVNHVSGWHYIWWHCRFLRWHYR